MSSRASFVSARWRFSVGSNRCRTVFASSTNLPLTSNSLHVIGAMFASVDTAAGGGASSENWSHMLGSKFFAASAASSPSCA